MIWQYLPASTNHTGHTTLPSSALQWCREIFLARKQIGQRNDLVLTSIGWYLLGACWFNWCSKLKQKFLFQARHLLVQDPHLSERGQRQMQCLCICDDEPSSILNHLHIPCHGDCLSISTSLPLRLPMEVRCISTGVAREHNKMHALNEGAPDLLLLRWCYIRNQKCLPVVSRIEWFVQSNSLNNDSAICRNKHYMRFPVLHFQSQLH